MTAIRLTTGNLHGTSHVCQETQIIITTGNLAGHPKATDLCIQKQNSVGNQEWKPPLHYSVSTQLAQY